MSKDVVDCFVYIGDGLIHSNILQNQDYSKNDGWNKITIGIDGANLTTTVGMHIDTLKPISRKIGNAIPVLGLGYSMISAVNDAEMHGFSSPQVISDALSIANNYGNMVIVATAASGAVVAPSLLAATVGTAILSTVVYAYTIPTIQANARENAMASPEFDQIGQNDSPDWEYPSDWELSTNDATNSVPYMTLSDIWEYIYDRTTNEISDITKNLPPNDINETGTIILSEFMPNLSLEDFLDYMTERAEASALQDGGGADGMDGQTGDGGNGDGGGADGGGGKWDDGNPPFAPDNPPPDQPPFSCQTAA